MSTGSSTSHHGRASSRPSNSADRRTRTAGPISPIFREQLPLNVSYPLYRRQLPVRRQTARRRDRTRTNADADSSPTTRCIDDLILIRGGSPGCPLTLHRLTTKHRSSFGFYGLDADVTIPTFPSLLFKSPQTSKFHIGDPDFRSKPTYGVNQVLISSYFPTGERKL